MQLLPIVYHVAPSTSVIRLASKLDRIAVSLASNLEISPYLHYLVALRFEQGKLDRSTRPLDEPGMPQFETGLWLQLLASDRPKLEAFVRIVLGDPRHWRGWHTLKSLLGSCVSKVPVLPA